MKLSNIPAALLKISAVIITIENNFSAWQAENGRLK